MILVISLNSSVDKIYTASEIIYGGVVRAQTVKNTAGGKGIHVANVMKSMKEDCILTGFVGQGSGAFIQRQLDAKKIKHNFVLTSGETRSCINIVTPDKKQTEILEPGPSITDDEQQQFLEKYKNLLKQSDIVVASGSLPSNIKSDFYNLLSKITHKANKKFFLDTSGKALEDSISSHPYLIKPNLTEAEKFTGHKINTVNDVAKAVSILQKDIAFPIISMGKDGAIAGYHGNIYHVIPPQVTAINSVGSGDAFTAGMAIGFRRKESIENILKLACACGTANAVEIESGYVEKEKVEEIYHEVVVKKI